MSHGTSASEPSNKPVFVARIGDASTPVAWAIAAVIALAISAAAGPPLLFLFGLGAAYCIYRVAQHAQEFFERKRIEITATYICILKGGQEVNRIPLSSVSKTIADRDNGLIVHTDTQTFTFTMPYADAINAVTASEGMPVTSDPYHEPPEVPAGAGLAAPPHTAAGFTTEPESPSSPDTNGEDRAVLASTPIISTQRALLFPGFAVATALLAGYMFMVHGYVSVLVVLVFLFYFVKSIRPIYQRITGDRLELTRDQLRARREDKILWTINLSAMRTLRVTRKGLAIDTTSENNITIHIDRPQAEWMAREIMAQVDMGTVPLHLAEPPRLTPAAPTGAYIMTGITTAVVVIAGGMLFVQIQQDGDGDACVAYATIASRQLPHALDMVGENSAAVRIVRGFGGRTLDDIGAQVMKDAIIKQSRDSQLPTVTCAINYAITFVYPTAIRTALAADIEKQLGLSSNRATR